MHQIKSIHSSSQSSSSIISESDQVGPCLIDVCISILILNEERSCSFTMSESKASHDGESDLKDPDLHRFDSISTDSPYTPVRSIVLNSSAPYPHRGRRHQRNLTIHEHATNGTTKDTEGGDQRGRDLKIQRTNSISLTNGPMRGDREARTVADFRTLSLGIKDTQRSEVLGNAQRRGKKEVKGLSHCSRFTLAHLVDFP